MSSGTSLRIAARPAHTNVLNSSFGVMSRSEIKRVDDELTAAIRDAKLGNQKLAVVDEAQQKLAQLQLAINNRSIEVALASIFGVDPDQLRKYVANADIGKFSFDNAKLVFQASTFSQVILKTFKDHPDLTKIDLRVCEVSRMTYLTDLFNEIVNTNITSIILPRNLTSLEYTAMSDATLTELMQRRKGFGLQIER